jgi:DNA end-binding protein Ku
MPVSREPAAPRPQNVVNLMDALRRSIAEGKSATTPHNKGRRRAQGQSEMLLAIPGKKSKDAAAKPAERSSAPQKRAG